jgi:TetR/AcrR family transcriptional regulator
MARKKKEQDQASYEEKLLQAAERVFIEKGYDGARTTEIAAEAGVTHAMLHYYFRTKENLFQKVLAQKLQFFQELLSTFASDPSLKLEDKLQKIVEAQFDLMRENPGLPRFMANEVIAKEGRRSMVADNVESIMKSILMPVQKDLDARGCDVGAYDLAIDIISLNSFVFIAYPLSGQIGATILGSEDAFFERRKKENVALILSRIRK